MRTSASIADNLARPAEPNSRLYRVGRTDAEALDERRHGPPGVGKNDYDTAQSTNPVQMQGLKLIAGAQQIVFGTDYPFGSAAKHLAGLEKCGFSAAELQGIRGANALRLFPRLEA